MKKYTGLTKRIMAMLLSGMLVLGAVPCSALAVSTDAESSQASEVVIEDTSSEEPMNTALEEPAQYYTITLDANGGYFENEWDDAIGDYVEQVEVINKLIPAEGTVTVVPVLEQKNAVVTFLGWSLERDGELITVEGEEYTPVGDCTLYAVWKIEEVEDSSPEEKESEDDTSTDAYAASETEEKNESSEVLDLDQQDEPTGKEEVNSDETEEEKKEESIVDPAEQEGTDLTKNESSSVGGDSVRKGATNSVMESESSMSVAFAGGNGTKSDPYQVSNAEQLNNIRNNLGAYYIQTADIDLTGIEWVAIGNLRLGEHYDNLVSFNGYYDGNGFSICNLSSSISDYYYYGLFGDVTGTVKNVHVNDISIMLDLEETVRMETTTSWSRSEVSKVYIGGVVACNGNGKQVTYCSSSGIIELTHVYQADVGGIVGQGSCSQSVNYTNIDIDGYVYYAGYGYSGGIYVGGILGDSAAIRNTISNSINYGSIIASADTYLYAGGISGRYGTPINCINTGEVNGNVKIVRSVTSTGNCDVGGIAGLVDQSEVSQCINIGRISGTLSGSGTCATGGIIGHGFDYSGSIKESFNLGSINGGGTGRIIGYCGNGTISEAYSLEGTTINDVIPTDCISKTQKNGEDISTSQLKDKTKVILNELGLQWDDLDVYVTWPDSNDSLSSKVISLIPENGEMNADHSLSEFCITFKEQIDLIKEGYAYLYAVDDSVSPLSKIKPVLDFKNDHSYKKLKIRFPEDILEPGKEYFVLMDPDFIEFGKYDNDSSGQSIFIPSGDVFEGIDNDGVWRFRTISKDYMHFENPITKIDEKLYDILYLPLHAKKIKAKDDGTHGTCYGWAYTVGAKCLGYPGVSGFGELWSLEDNSKYGTTSRTILEYCQLAHLYQYKLVKHIEEDQHKCKNENKYNDLYNAILGHINGTGGKIIICVFADNGNEHALYPLEITSETDSEITVRVLNANRKDGSFYDMLTLVKNDGKITGFNIGYYNKEITYVTITNDLDSIFLGDVTPPQDLANLVHTSSLIEDKGLIEEKRLMELKGANDEEDSSPVEEKHLYWCEDQQITLNINEGDEVGFTDGYEDVSVSTSTDATVTINLDEMTAIAQSLSGDSSEIEISYIEATNSNDTKTTTLTCTTSGAISSQKVSEGFVIYSPGSEDISVSTDEDSIKATTNGDSVLIKSDNSKDIEVFKDPDGDGEYNQQINVETYNGNKTTITESMVTGIQDKVYSDKEIQQEVVIINGDKERLTEGIDYTVVYGNNVNAGTATVTITGIGDYEGIITKSFTINPASIATSTLSGMTGKTYTGQAHIQSPTLKLEDKVLIYGTDYALTYSNNTNAGTATVTITGKGNYTGTKTATFKINKAAQSITVKSSASSIAVGKTATVSITGAKGTKSFKSSNTAIATVNASTGVVTGKKAGTVTITATSAATANYNVASKTVKITVTANKTLKKPGNCHFAKWNNSKYTGCRISWNKVDGAEGYQTLLSWTDGSHSSATIVKSNVLYRDCTVHPQHVSQMKVRAFYTLNGQRKYGPWSNLEYITPSPAKLTTKNASSGSNLKMNISWNIIYGCNGYNVFITTNPNGKWYWNQSTTEKATATSASIDKCGGAKLKKNTRYYVRIVTRRKRNGVFCTVPMPANNTYIGSFVIK